MLTKSVKSGARNYVGARKNASASCDFSNSLRERQKSQEKAMELYKWRLFSMISLVIRFGQS